MKYAIKYYRGCEILDKADELIIKYTERNGNLIHFAQKIPQKQRLIVNISGLTEEEIQSSMEIFKATIQVKENIAFLISLNQKQTCTEFELNQWKYFFIEPAETLDDFQNMLSYKISDIYISGELGFYLEIFNHVCEKKEIQMRVFPNVCQSSSKIIPKDTLTTFFIRPEDLRYYEGFNLVIEFFGPLSKQPVLYEIYRDGRWMGDLDDLILGMKEHIDNNAILPAMGMYRKNCKKRCAFMDCQYCNLTFVNIANKLQEKGLGFYTPKRIYDEELCVNEEPLSDVTEAND